MIVSYPNEEWVRVNFPSQNKIWQDLETNAAFKRPSHELSMDQKRELAVKRQYAIFPKQYVTLQDVCIVYICIWLKWSEHKTWRLELLAANHQSRADDDRIAVLLRLRSIVHHQIEPVVGHVSPGATHDGQQRLPAAACRRGRSLWYLRRLCIDGNVAWLECVGHANHSPFRCGHKRVYHTHARLWGGQMLDRQSGQVDHASDCVCATVHGRRRTPWPECISGAGTRS